MNNSSHPVSVLKPKFTEIIRDSVARAEKDGRLTKAQLSLIFEQHWFKMLVPSACGGMQMQLPEALKLAEALAWADGSVGWEIALCAGAGWLSCFADAEMGHKIFADAKACASGSAEASGTAEKTDDGYTINGKWSHLCGTNEATVFAVNCVMTRNGEPVRNETTNSPQIVSFYLTREEVTVSSSWNTIGLTAASNHNIEVKELKVATERGMKSVGHPAKIEAPLFKFPYQQLMEAMLAINLSGMAVHFVDLCDALLNELKNRNGYPLAEDRTVKDIFEKQISKLDDARVKLIYAIELSWQTSLNFRQIKPAILYKVSAASYELAEKARSCVDTLFPYCGMAATDKASEINRVWRDIHSAGQNNVLVTGSLPE